MSRRGRGRRRNPGQGSLWDETDKFWNYVDSTRVKQNLGATKALPRGTTSHRAYAGIKPTAALGGTKALAIPRTRMGGRGGTGALIAAGALSAAGAGGVALYERSKHRRPRHGARRGGTGGGGRGNRRRDARGRFA